MGLGYLNTSGPPGRSSTESQSGDKLVGMPTPRWLRLLGEKIADKVAEYIVGAMIVAVVSVVAVRLKNVGLEWPLAIVYASVMLGGLALGINQLAHITARRRDALRANRTPAEIEEQITEWFLYYQFSVRRQPIPTCDFGLVADDAGKVAVTIAKPSKFPGVTVASNV